MSLYLKNGSSSKPINLPLKAMAEGMRVLYGSDKKKCNEEFVNGRGYQS